MIHTVATKSGFRVDEKNLQGTSAKKFVESLGLSIGTH